MRAIDMGRVSHGLAREGMDTRHWVSYGTVAAVGGADGAPDYSDPNAVVISPSGVDVDVVLEPSGYPVTCRWGLQAGAVSILAPIRPGDQVIVVLPDGDVSMIPEIVRVISGASAPLPVEEDGMPVFRNDRLSIFARGVPVEIRTDAGNAIRLRADGTVEAASPAVAVVADQDGTISLGASAADALVKGTTYRAAQATQSAQIEAAIATLQAVCVTPPLSALSPGLAQLLAAFVAFEAQAAGFLSAVSKTE